MATLPFVNAPPADVRTIRAVVERWRPAGTPSTNALLAVALEPQLRLYLLGLLSSRLGEHDVAMRQKQPERALSLLGVADGEVPLELVVVRPFVNARQYTQEHARWLRAEALRALGRREEAARWDSLSFQGSPIELLYRRQPLSSCSGGGGVAQRGRLRREEP